LCVPSAREQALVARASARDDRSARGRGFLASALARDGHGLRTSEIQTWLEDRRRSHRFAVRPIPFEQLESWAFDPETGNLRHASGRFFTVEGLRVTTSYPSPATICQPIINQPEIGILGILARRLGGVLHFLMQAKMEPGNINLVQLSPTVQATRSNYTQVHRGTRPRYLEYFLEPRPGRVLADQLQSEQGSFFLRKRNRNVIIEVEEEVPAHEDYCWLTLGQLKAALREANVVNMDSRTVLSLLPLTSSESELAAMGLEGSARADGSFAGALLRSSLATSGCVCSAEEIMSWLTCLKAFAEILVRELPLDSLPGWTRDDESIHRDDRDYFSVIAISAEADNREVRGWSQPIVKPHAMGVSGFLVKQFDGILHFLVQGHMEPGIFDMIEMAPTVQFLPGSATAPPPYLDLFLSPPPGSVRLDCLQSEEGGRFYHYQTRNLVIELPDPMQVELERGYTWMSLGQINQFLRYNNFVNIEARGLIACLGLDEWIGSGQ
jgi:dTDP-4-dehydro-6-deoxy-alpha-D-glucopyranose 2,3-dehydratase